MAVSRTVDQVIHDLRTAPSNTERGEKFERLMVDYFYLDPTLAHKPGGQPNLQRTLPPWRGRPDRSS